MKKGEYEIYKSNKDKVTVQAWEFEVFGYCTMIVHRDLEFNNLWTVSEPRTGAYVTRRHATRKKAIEQVNKEFHIDGKISPEGLAKNIEEWVALGHKTKYYEENYAAK